MMMNETIHMFGAGAGVYGIRQLLGNYINKFTINYLGIKRGGYA